ncbi:hypothetical protein [Streptomyces sp. NPDC008121]|uniref:hypothetical protein n=1 Tax=Streptomyces sp. NPDC008121 TaxID=3364809 RepID=UPI0036E91E99
MQIATDGYSPALVPLPGGQVFTIEQNSVAFFPLYPGLMGMAVQAAGIGPYGAGMTVSIAASFAAAAGIYRIGELSGDSRTGLIAACLWAVMPGAGVQWSVYSESLYTALAAWTCCAVMRHAWHEAALLSCLAGLTRPSAVALIIAVCAAASIALYSRQGHWRGPLLAICVAPAGAALYVGWVGWSLDDPAAYFILQRRAWAHSFDFGRNAFAAARAILLGRQDYLFPSPAQDVAALLVLFLLPVLLVLMLRYRLPAVLMVYTCASLVLMLSSMQMFGTVHRFLLPLFPLVIPAAAGLRRLSVRCISVLLVSLSVSSGWYAGFLLFGLGIP